MALDPQIFDITKFLYGETVEFTIACKNRDGTPIITPASQQLIVAIGNSPDAAPWMAFDSTPEIVLTDVGLAVWTVTLKSADLSLLGEGRFHHYSAKTVLGTDDPIYQKSGRILLRNSI